MSEPRIAVKLVAGHFISCWPMPAPRPDEITFYQDPREHHCRREEDVSGLMEYARTKEDLNS